MLAMGTDWVLPTCPRLPTPSMVSAAEPVVGHGRVGDVPGRGTDVVRAGRNTGRGTVRVHWSPANTPRRATRRTKATGMGQSRRRAAGRVGAPEFRGRTWAGPRPGGGVGALGRRNSGDARGRGPGGSWASAG